MTRTQSINNLTASTNQTMDLNENLSNQKTNSISKSQIKQTQSLPIKSSIRPSITHVNDHDHLMKLLDDAEDKLVVIDFYAAWCGPCKSIAPDIIELSNTILDVIFLKVDIDENDEIACEYDVNSMPTFVFMRNHKLIHSFSGARIEKVRDLINQYKIEI